MMFFKLFASQLSVHVFSNVCVRDKRKTDSLHCACAGTEQDLYRKCQSTIGHILKKLG